MEFQVANVRCWRILFIVGVALALAARSISASEVELQEIATGFNKPTALTGYPGDPERVVLVEQRGVVYLLDRRNRSSQILLDIEARVRSGGEMGLLSLVFHPLFPEDRRVFVYYTEERWGLQSVLSEFVFAKDRVIIDPRKERRILLIPQPFENHNGGQLAFGPDRKLYVGVGDGGGRWDPHGNGQRLDMLLGKILRLDVENTNGHAPLPYRIPEDNPFRQVQGVRPEIWAYGLRNPWRFSFDRETGELWAGDVGQNSQEEIDRIERAGNYGWAYLEGLNCACPEGCASHEVKRPLYVYGRDDGFSVTGGYVCRGCGVASLEGSYIYGDFGSGKIWALRTLSNGEVENRLLLNTRKNLSTFGEGADGAIYVADYGGGNIYRLVASLKTP